MGRVALVVRAVLFGILFIASLSLLPDREGNRCSMTYMFEMPKFRNLYQSIWPRLPYRQMGYGLYLYGEGHTVERDRDLQLSGIPVLYIPGNAGSEKQVRSLASVALRKAQTLQSPFHLDFFTIAYNEEFVALYGGVLERQTRFANACLHGLLSLYPNRPQSVVLVGHSMGGVVTRGLFALPGFDSSLVSVVISLATPQLAPVVMFDSLLRDYLEHVNAHWLQNAEQLRHVSILSVGGGHRDREVRSALTSLRHVDVYNNTVSVVTCAVPLTWQSPDHQAIVWCKELVLAIIRSLFDMVDDNRKQITNSAAKRMDILRHHFIRNPGVSYSHGLERNVEFPVSSVWVLKEKARWRFKKHKMSESLKGSVGTFYVFPILSKNYSHFYCRSNDMELVSWIYGCSTYKNDVCLKGEDLSGKAERIPGFKVSLLDLPSLASFTHVTIFVPKGVESKLLLECEFLNLDQRTLTLPAPSIFSLGFTSNEVSIVPGGLLFNFKLDGASKVYQAFKAHVERKCTSTTGEDLLRLHIPWSHEDSFMLGSPQEHTLMDIRFQTGRPPLWDATPTLHLHAFPHCSYRVTLQTSLVNVLGQIMRFHVENLPAYFVTSLLLAFGRQLSDLLSQGFCPDFHSAQTDASKPYKIQPFVVIFHLMASSEWFSALWIDFLPLPEPDSVLMERRSTWFNLLPLLLFLLADATLYWMATLCWGIVHVLATLLSKTWRFESYRSEQHRSTSSCLPVSIVLTAVAWTQCGALSLILLCIFSILKVAILKCKVTSLKAALSKTLGGPVQSRLVSEADGAGRTSENAESWKLRAKQCLDTDQSTLNLHSTATAATVCVTLFSLPSALHWFRQLHVERKLKPDPHFPVAILFCLMLPLLLQTSSTAIRSSMVLQATTTLHLLLPIITAVFSTVHLYRIPYFVVVSLIPLALARLF
uniref:GPI inositol-deacylase n=1 Tax=Eptatretus burgeri TaxID=7764 RepID=A0A8C4Q9F5_EPTBU